MNYLLTQTETFKTWHLDLKDLRAKVAVARRIERAQAGTLGDVELVGGDKSTQKADIRKAIQMAQEI